MIQIIDTKACATRLRIRVSVALMQSTKNRKTGTFCSHLCFSLCRSLSVRRFAWILGKTFAFNFAVLSGESDQQSSSAETFPGQRYARVVLDRERERTRKRKERQGGARRTNCTLSCALYIHIDECPNYWVYPVYTPPQREQKNRTNKNIDAKKLWCFGRGVFVDSKVLIKLKPTAKMIWIIGLKQRRKCKNNKKTKLMKKLVGFEFHS